MLKCYHSLHFNLYLPSVGNSVCHDTAINREEHHLTAVNQILNIKTIIFNRSIFKLDHLMVVLLFKPICSLFLLIVCLATGRWQVLQVLLR